ncbi:MAG: hypothetical protein M0P69_04515 [Bacteroidales bacterium]|nr:hypothetical protein [Bacteroidales bacterium]
MTQEKVMIKGKELRVGCIVKDYDGDFLKVLAFDKDMFCFSNFHKSKKNAEKDNAPDIVVEINDIQEIISYPVLGQDKNGDDVWTIHILQLVNVVAIQ